VAAALGGAAVVGREAAVGVAATGVVTTARVGLVEAPVSLGIAGLFSQADAAISMRAAAVVQQMGALFSMPHHTLLALLGLRWSRTVIKIGMGTAH
jgi:hypothetical protein